MKKYLLVIYGKNGCERCIKLKKDVSLILEQSGIADDFEMDYQNLSTIEGMQAYALAETVNGQRLPAMQIMKYSEEKNSYVKISYPGTANDTASGLKPYYLQLETSYSSHDSFIGVDKIKELMSIAHECP